MAEEAVGVEGLLREILARQERMEVTLESVHDQARKTNGRVTALERAHDVEKALEKERAKVLQDQVASSKEAASRRQWKIGLAVGAGMSLLITVLAWVGAHVG